MRPTLGFYVFSRGLGGDKKKGCRKCSFPFFRPAVWRSTVSLRVGSKAIRWFISMAICRSLRMPKRIWRVFGFSPVSSSCRAARHRETWPRRSACRWWPSNGGHQALSGTRAGGLLRVGAASRGLQAQCRKTRASPRLTGAGLCAADSQCADRGAVGYVAQGDQCGTSACSKKNGNGVAGGASAQGCAVVEHAVSQVAAGLREAQKPEAASTLSDRSLDDSQAEMGHGTTRSLERGVGACGLLISAELEFVAADDVPNGGVLCALPALLAEGLLRHTRTFYRLPPGFYPLESIFLALALLALVRCRSLEQSRYLSPGEWGKLLGLDRLPEVKPCGEKSPNSAATTVRQPSGRAAWLG